MPQRAAAQWDHLGAPSALFPGPPCLWGDGMSAARVGGNTHSLRFEKLPAEGTRDEGPGRVRRGVYEDRDN